MGSPPSSGRATSGRRSGPCTGSRRAGCRSARGWVGQALGQPYGGVKQSGIGREFSLEGMLDSFTRKKSVTVNLAVPAP